MVSARMNCAALKPRASPAPAGSYLSNKAATREQADGRQLDIIFTREAAVPDCPQAWTLQLGLTRLHE